MDSFEENLKKVVTTSLGAIISAVEQSRDAIMEFAGSDKAKELSQKGEEALQIVLDASSQAVNKVKEAVVAADENDKARREKARMVDMAYRLHSMDASQHEELDRLLKELEKTKSTTSSDDAGLPNDGIGKPGVTESEFDLDTNLPDKSEGKKPTRDPLASATPTSPDDEQNVRRSQTNNMNDHLNQNVPPDF